MGRKRKEPEPAEEPLTERMRRIRAERGLSRAEAAERVGIAPRTWMYYETGKQKPGKPVLLLIGLLEKGTI